MKIYRIASGIDDKIWQIISEVFPEMDLILYPSDVDSFKRELSGIIDKIRNRIDYATKDPKSYALDFKEWQYDEPINLEEADDAGFEREDKE